MIFDKIGEKVWYSRSGKYYIEQRGSEKNPYWIVSELRGRRWVGNIIHSTCRTLVQAMNVCAEHERQSK